MYNIISSGSKGNAIIYLQHVLVDCGVAFSHLKPHIKDIKIILLTHEHGDHFKQNTIAKIATNYPKIIFFAPEWLYESLKRMGIRNVFKAEMNKVYQLGSIIVSPFELTHDVKNCGWRIIRNDKRIFHATDTFTLEGIEAKNYSLYAIEFNYDEKTIQQVIDEKKENGEFSYEERAVKNHLSWQKAQAFYDLNKGSNSELLKLHVSSRYGEVDEQIHS